MNELARDSARGGRSGGSSDFDDFDVVGPDVDATADESLLRPGGDEIVVGDSVSSESPIGLSPSVIAGNEGLGKAADSAPSLDDGLL